MITRLHRSEFRKALEDASIHVQAWMETILYYADHGDTEAEEKVKLFLKHYRKTHSPKMAQAAVNLKYDQMRFEDMP